MGPDTGETKSSVIIIRVPGPATADGGTGSAGEGEGKGSPGTGGGPGRVAKSEARLPCMGYNFSKGIGGAAAGMGGAEYPVGENCRCG
jgi:hypothetical protein